MRLRIEVRLRPGVTDPEGENVHKALQLLGFKGIRGVASAKRFLVDLDERDGRKARAAAEEMCRRLLANPVIHEYDIEVVRPRKPAAHRKSTPRPRRPR